MTTPMTESAIVSRRRAAGCEFAEDEARLILATARTPDDASAMVDRRAAGLPLEHVLGWAEFCGLRIAVEPGVFVPRRRTEFLVRRAAALVPPRPVVVDLCCGSGALGAALVSGLDEFALHAADVEPAAVRCARRNIAPLGGHAYQGDLFAPLPDALRGRVDVLLANVPYVPTGDVALMPAEARDHEPRVALDGGPDGLDVLRRVTAEAARWLVPGGHLLFETSERQVPDAVGAVERGGLAAAVETSEEYYATVIIGAKPV
jgi:release factor glutamine methyltransferase